MNKLSLVLKGMAYGVTHVIPGLGGAMVLILMGIYEPFVDAVGNIFVQRRRWREFLTFIIPLGIGMVLGIILAAKLIADVLANYRVATNLFFMGLLVGTVPSILRIQRDMRPRVGRILAWLGGLAVVAGLKLLEAYLVTHQGEPLTLASFSELRVVGYNSLISFLAGCASVTPGLDGSLVLILGGTYEPVLQAVGALTHLQIHWAPLISTAGCAVLGILVFSKLVDTVIKRAPAHAYYGVLGLLTGAFYVLWPREPAGLPWVVLILIFAVGVALALWLGRQPATSRPSMPT